MRLDPLAPEDFLPWRTDVRGRFAALRAGTGTMTELEAAERADEILTRLLPEGLRTPEHHLRRLVDGDKVVGDLWLHLPAALGDGAFLYDLRLTAEAVGRGLGPAAMDLAEQTARESGAAVLRLNMFTADAPTRGLVEGRGYEPTGTQMVLRLDGPPDGERAGELLPSTTAGTDVVLSPVTPAQYEVFIADQEADYAAEIVASGSASPAQAAAKAAADMATLLPTGRDTPNHFFFMASAAGDDVGWLWLEVEAAPGGVRAFVFDIVVDEQFRRRGHGRAIMKGAEREARDRGATTLSLNVFGHNHGARALYDSLGYRPTETLLRKVL
jgi:GNAT superfamily N-acetyltransferase